MNHDNDEDDDDDGDEVDDNDGGDDDDEDCCFVVVERQLPKTLPTLFGASTKRNLQLRVVCNF